MNVRSYVIITPEGYKEEITNLAAYCRKHDLNRSALGNILCNRAKSHRGYRIMHAD